MYSNNDKRVLFFFFFLRKYTFRYISSLIDDPYYCGLRARVPNFVKMAKNSKVSTRGYARPPNQAPTYTATGYATSQSSQIYGHLPGNRPPIMYHARSFESGLGIITLLQKFWKIFIF